MQSIALVSIPLSTNSIMFETENDVSPYRGISNGKNGFASGGSMNNPMYQNICCTGAYTPATSRSKKRTILREKYGIKLNKGKNFWDL
jgi:hypothetical protein